MKANKKNTITWTHAGRLFVHPPSPITTTTTTIPPSKHVELVLRTDGCNINLYIYIYTLIGTHKIYKLLLLYGLH